MKRIKKIFFWIMPSTILAPIIFTSVSCSNNMYVKNKEDLLSLIEHSQNEVRAMIRKVPQWMFDENINTPFLKKYEYDNSTGKQIVIYWKSQDLLNDEKLYLIFFNLLLVELKVQFIN